jgi:hypothetical protein
VRDKLGLDRTETKGIKRHAYGRFGEKKRRLHRKKENFILKKKRFKKKRRETFAAVSKT